MSITKEQLLSPRFKVIADYPGSRYQIGDIIEESKNYEGAVFFKESVHKYPHIFRLMGWWEEREIQEMPMFLNHPKDKIFKVRKWIKKDDTLFYSWNDRPDTTLNFYTFIGLLPANEEDYNSYINKQK